MNNVEFDKWFAFLTSSFPSVRSWFVLLGMDDQCGVRESWRESLEDIELRDANAVITRMLMGDDAAPPADRELLGAHVRSLGKANAIRRLDRRRDPHTKSVEQGGRLRDDGAAGFLRRMLQVIDDNPNLSAREAAEQVMPPISENPHGRRFDCGTCLDSGIVMVWSPLSVQAAIRGELDQPAKRKTCGAPCSCRAGDHYVWRNSGDPPKGWTGWLNTDVVYSVERYCVCQGNDTDSPIAIESFKDWVADRQLAAVNSKREPEFAEWNAGGKENAVAD